MNKRFLIYFFISFVITLSALMAASSVLYKRADPVVKNNILSFVQDRLGVEYECEFGESIGYVHYVDSEWEKNNKFGLYIYAENKKYFELAQQLVNSNGGDWGYVLIPYNIKDRDYERWVRVFEQLRNKHLIPIVQLWDVDPDNYMEQTEDAAKFLNGFIWPIKERYISVYNEVNSADFWYGNVDPEQYVRVLDFTIDAFKEVSSDYFMMNGAFNTSSYTDGNHLDSFEFMRRMDSEMPGIFEKLDGWASHPYPQPNFSGNPFAKGRWSIKAYEDELSYLENLGVDKKLPVFITETGWAHAQGEDYNDSYYDAELVAEYFKIAFEEIWLPDERVRAVTPFTIRYQPPYDHFSWVNEDYVPYEQYEQIKSLEKIQGNPPQFREDSLRISGCDE